MCVNRCSFIISYAVATSGAATRRLVSPAFSVGILTNVGRRKTLALHGRIRLR